MSDCAEMNRAIGAYFVDYIKSKVSSGRYKNASEVVRAGLRLLEEKNRNLALKRAIQEGIESGIAHDFDPEAHLAELKAKKDRNVKLRPEN